MTITRYEIRAYKNGASIYLAMTERRTLSCLLSVMRAEAQDIADNLHVADEATITSKTVADGVQLSDGTVIRFSGRTEYEMQNAARLEALTNGVDPDADAIAIAAAF